MNSEDVIFHETLDLSLGHFSAKSVFLYITGYVPPAQPQLFVVVMVQFVEHLDSLLSGQGELAFVGGGVNVLQIPNDGNFFLPESGQDLFRPVWIFQRRPEHPDHLFNDERVHTTIY